MSLSALTHLSRLLSRHGRLTALLVTGVLGPGPALAYIDPNAGGWLYQLLFPMLVAIGAAWAGLRTQIRMWWARWRSGSRKPYTPPPEGPADGDAP